MVVNCILYTNGKKDKEIPLQEVANHPRTPESFVWVALVDPFPDEFQLIQTVFQLHPLAMEDAQKGHQRPKLEEYDEVLFTVLKIPYFQDQSLLFGEINLFVGPSFIISIRKDIEHGFSKVRDRCEAEPHLLALGTGFLYYALIDNIIDRYYPIVETLEKELELIEDQIFVSQANRNELQQLYLLKQKIIHLKHSATSTLDFISKLHGGRVPKICVPLQDYFRDVYDHLLRVEQSVESIRETIITAMQVNLNLITMSEGETTKKLASWAALIGFPTMVAGIYGMNFEQMPELKHPWGYPITLTVMAIGNFILYYRFKKAKWI